jgi:hypothetical protein
MKTSTRALLFGAAAAVLVAHSLVFNFVSDDAFISFVYSRNLAEHGQLVFNLGDHVEGYTNFLWTALLGGLLALGLPAEITSRVLGTAFGVATLWVTVVLADRLRGRSAGSLLPAAVLATSSGFACWCSGGLETQMFTFFVMLGVDAAVADRMPRAGLAFGLAALTRPEGALVFAVVALHRVIANAVQGRVLPTRSELLGVAAFLALFAPYFAWRWWYYGWPFPNTFYVKAGGTPPPGYALGMLEHGLYYVGQWAWQTRLPFAAPLVAVAVVKHRRFGGLALGLIVAYLGYAVWVGGDFMGLHRFIMPATVLTLFLASLGLLALPRWALLLVVPWAVSQAFLTRASLQPVADHRIDRPGYLALYAHDRALMGKALEPHIRPGDFAILGGAGVLPYYARLPGIDVFGLVSEDIAHNEPPSVPRPGHQKWGRAERLLKTNPTFLLHCYDLHRDPDRYTLCGEAGYFQARGYEPVTLHIPGLLERGEYFTFLKRKDRAWP